MNIKWKDQKISGIIKIAISLGIIICLIISLSIALSALIKGEIITMKSASWLCYGVISIATFIGNIVWMEHDNREYLIRIIITTIGVLLLWVIFNILLFDGMYSAGWGSLVAVMIGSIGALIIPYIRPQKRRYKKYRSR